MFSQVTLESCSLSLGMRNLKIASIFAYKDQSSCHPLREYWKNLSMTDWNHIYYCSNNNFSVIQYHMRNNTGHAIEYRTLEAMKY